MKLTILGFIQMPSLMLGNPSSFSWILLHKSQNLSTNKSRRNHQVFFKCLRN